MISIIVPVYNAEKTIERCVDSIIKQTYIDWELLLINDGSNDNSPVICDRYAEQDSRIRAFHKENGGVSSARNLGLNNVNGDWVTFVDSDDWIKDKYLEHLISHVDDCIDLIISHADSYSSSECNKLKEYPTVIVNDENFDIAFAENKLYWNVALWSKLFKVEIVKKYKINFIEGIHVGEDVCFLYSFILKSNNIYISGDTDYCYFDCRENSLSNSVHSLESEILSYHNVKILVEQLIEKKNINNISALFGLWQLIASHQRRILNSLYYNKIDRFMRLKVLYEINWEYYIKYIYVDSIRAHVLINLLKYKFYRLYDLVRTFYVLIKYKK